MIEPLNLTEARHAMLKLPMRAANDGAQPYDGARQNRLTADWAFSILSPDQEIRVSLRQMRGRSRRLANNNDYGRRFLMKAQENVIGPNGVCLQMNLDEQSGAAKFNQPIEDSFARWSESASVDGRMAFVDFSQLWLGQKLMDGESFVRKVRGYPHSKFRFGLQPIDADTVDESLHRERRMRTDGTFDNEIRMGVEIDEWRRPVAFHVFDGHPSERIGVKRLRIPAAEMDQAFTFRRWNQTRGVPWMHTAMTRLYMLGKYEEAEMVAARLGACKVGFFTSKTGDEYAGPKSKDGHGKLMAAEPGTFEELPEGVEPKTVNWDHPNVAFAEFTKAMLRGAAVGLNTSYSGLSGDLRDVNFSSLRHGVLEEREGWRLLQTFAIRHHYRPVFADWLLMAVTSGQLELPAKLPLEAVLEAAQWTARGWDWVDPLKDVQADIRAMASASTTLKDVCAKRGIDWRDNIDQRALEIEYARTKGVPLDLTTSGAGGIEGATGDEQGAGREGTKGAA